MNWLDRIRASLDGRKGCAVTPCGNPFTEGELLREAPEIPWEVRVQAANSRPETVRVWAATCESACGKAEKFAEREWPGLGWRSVRALEAS